MEKSNLHNTHPYSWRVQLHTNTPLPAPATNFAFPKVAQGLPLQHRRLQAHRRRITAVLAHFRGGYALQISSAECLDPLPTPLPSLDSISNHLISPSFLVIPHIASQDKHKITKSLAHHNGIRTTPSNANPVRPSPGHLDIKNTHNSLSVSA